MCTLVNPSVTSEPAASSSPGNLSECRIPDPIPDLLNEYMPMYSFRGTDLGHIIHRVSSNLSSVENITYSSSNFGAGNNYTLYFVSE
jgi:hypothetical protein